MCGLAFSSSATCIAYLDAAIKHRGPDSTALHASPVGTLVHHRLSIVGVNDDRASQPCLTQDGNLVVAFNGELFDAPALYLDSEVRSLAEHLRKGRRVSELNGYCAAISIEPSQRLVSLHRDLAGVSPLFYALHDGHLSVCSEHAPLASLGLRVRRVLPGEALSFRRDKKSFKLVHQHKTSYPNLPIGPKSSAEATRAVVRNAILRVTLHSDVPMCVALSDGFDSRALLQVLREAGHTPTCYTVTDPNGWTPTALREYMSDYPGAWQLIPATDGALQEAHAAYTKHLRPLLGDNVIAQRAFARHWLVACNAKEKVILCGEGADELYCGYPSHARALTQLGIVGLARKRLSTLRSMDVMVLYRANLAGMLHSKEVRVPFLDQRLVAHALAHRPALGKGDLRAAFPEFEYIPKYTELDAVLTRQMKEHNASL